MNTFTTLNRTASTLAAVAILAALSSPLHAQPQPPTTAADNPAAPASGEKIVLDELVVTNTNSTKTALPVRPVSGDSQSNNRPFTSTPTKRPTSSPAPPR